MPQLDPTWFASQIFWLFVSFSLLYFLLSKVVLPPLQKIIELRKTSIEDDLTAAQKLKEEAEEARKSYEETLVRSRDSAQSLIAEAEIEAKKGAEEAIKSLDAQLATQSQTASRKIEEKKKELVDGLMLSTSDFSKIIVEKLTGKVPSAEQIEKALEQSRQV